MTCSLNLRNDTKDATIRIAVGAQAFGLGPVSKAASIARALTAAEPRVEAIFCAGSVCREYLIGESLWRAERDVDLEEVGLDRLAAALGPLDAAVVVLDPELTTSLGRCAPCYFVDSLGFMWGRAFLDRYPAVRDAERYFVQDAFDAADHLARLGVRNVHPVGGIIDSAMAPGDVAPHTIVHLGGLLNIFSAAPVRAYVDGILNLLDRLRLPDDTRILTSRSAQAAFEELSRSRYPVDSLPHATSLWMFSQARSVLTSPGLTTLLELTAQRIPFVPLPPQNMSQALIVYHVARFGTEAPEIWRFLASQYPIEPAIEEAEGVRLVQQRNADLLSDPGFADAYAHLAERTRTLRQPLPVSLVRDMNGAAAIRAAILSDVERKR